MVKNFKKYLAFMLAITLTLSTYSFSFAAEAIDDVDVVKLLGMLKGDGDGLTKEYLDKKTTRLQAAIMYLRLNGLEEEAMLCRESKTFSDANELTWTVGKNILAYLKAHPDLGWQGDNKGEFNPYDIISAQEYTKVMLQALGYEQDVDFKWSEVFTYAAEKGLVKSASVQTLTNRDIATITVEALKANNSDDVKLVDQLVEAGIIDKELAKYCGLYKPVITVDADIDSAVAINSKLVEVHLTQAVESVDASVFKVKSDNKMIEIVSAELAPWDQDKKTALITLETRLSSGELYSITNGDSMVNFGGRSSDVKKPTLYKATGIDYNEIMLEFSEPIRIDNLKVSVAEKYYNKKALEIYSIEYINHNTVKVMTSEQDACLYGVTVSGATDLAGNIMQEDTIHTFVGTEKSTAPQVVSKAKAIDYNKIYIEFKTNIDVESIQDATFEVKPMYIEKDVIEVFSAEQATAVQAVEFNPNYKTDTDKAKAVKKGIVLTVDGKMDESLYKVTVSGMKTLYGQSMSSSNSERMDTFVGKAKPTGAFCYQKYRGIVPTSATTVNIIFERKIEESTAEDISNYTIEEAYETKYALPVLDAELLDDGKTVKLKVDEMKSVLYKLSTKNIVDIYGNSQKTGSDAEKTFVGQEKESRITAIDSIVRTGEKDREIKVKFNAKVGNNAKDVALYKISNNIGYPESIQTYSDDPYSVKLTIPKTTETISYKLTVHGLYNADGVAMNSDGVSGYFTGRGIAKGLPMVQAVMSIDKHAIKVYFDRDVTSQTIRGVLWDKNNNNGVEPFFVRKEDRSNASYISLDGLKAYQDTRDKNCLVIVDDDPSWRTGSGFSTYKFDLTSSYNNKYVRLEDNVSDLLVVAKDTPYTYPIVEGMQGMNSRTVKIYFSKPVDGFEASDITIKRDSDNQNVQITSNPIAISGTSNMQWLVPVDTEMQSVSYWARFVHGSVHDKYLPNIYLSTRSDIQSSGDIVKEFAGNSNDEKDIENVYAIMTDNQTIQVHYPESMYYNPDVIDNSVATSTNHQNVDNISSYKLRKLDGQVIPDSNLRIKYIDYNETKKMATIYLNRSIDDSISTYNLLVDTNVANITRNKTVADNAYYDQALKIEVVNMHHKVNHGPGITNASVSGDRMQLRVTMDSVIAFGNGNHNVDGDSLYTSIQEFVNKTTRETIDVNPPKTTTLPVTKDLLKALKVVTTFVGENERTVRQGDLRDVSIAIDGKTLIFTFNKAIAAGANGYVTTKTNDTTASTDLYNYNMVKRSKTDYESKISFAAPNSGIFDYIPPMLLESECMAYDTNNDDKIEKIEVAFNEEIQPVGSLKTALTTLNIGGNNKLSDVNTVTVSNSKIVINMKDTVSANKGAVEVTFSFSDHSNSNTITDNNNNKVEQNKTVTIDSFVPKIMDITTSTVDGLYSAGTAIFIDVLFSEKVNVTDTPVIKLSDSIGPVSYTTGTGTNKLTFKYTVDASHKSQDLYITDVEGIIRDDAEHNADLSINVDSFKDAHAIVIDTVAGINSITSDAPTAKSYYKENDVIKIYVNFAEVVNVTGIPTITLSDEIGKINCTSGTGSQSLLFEYTVGSGHNSEDLYITAIEGTIKDVNGDNADLSINTQDFKDAYDIVIDNSVASINSITTTALADTYKEGQLITIKVQFSEDVKVTGAPTITLSDGIVGTATYKPGVETDTLTFEYQVGNGDNCDTLEVKSINIDADNRIEDMSSNAVNVGISADKIISWPLIVIDNTKPEIESITTTKNVGPYKKGEVIPIKVTFKENVNVTGIPTITLSDTIGSINCSSNADKELIFNYTVEDNQNSLNLSVTEIAGDIKDEIGNEADLVKGLPIKLNIAIDTKAPTGFDDTDIGFLGFSNATGKVIATGNVAPDVTEKGKLQVAFGTDENDAESGVISDSILDDDLSWNDSDEIITGIDPQTAGENIYYRLIDEAGNATSWVQDGSVVTPLADLTPDQKLKSGVEKDGFTFTNNDGSADTIIGNEIVTAVRGKIYFYKENESNPFKQTLTASETSPLTKANFVITNLEDYTLDTNIKITLVDMNGNESAFSKNILLDVVE